MNILFISSQFPNSLEPNRGVFSYQIVKELSLLADVKVIAPLPSSGCFRWVERLKKYKTKLDVPNFEVLESIPVYHPRYAALPGLGLLHQWAYERAVVALIREINDQWPISVVNCHWLFPDGVAIQKICMNLGVPVMLTALGTDLNRYCNFKFRKIFIKKALCQATKVSVLSQEMLTKCISLGVSSGHLVNIANGVDTVKFNIIDKGSARANLEIDPDVKMLLFVGSLVPVKNISTLIKSFSLVMEKKTTANTKLYIVGSGFLEKKLKDLSVKLNLQEKIVFVGPVPHDTLPLWMSAADCLCLPSLSEGHPNVMMEALACGTPVVGSRVGSISDFIGGDRSNGYAVEPTNVSDIAEKLNAVLGFSYSRNQIRHTVLAYSWKNCAEKYYSALRLLI